MRLRKLATMREALADSGYFGELLSGDSWRAWRVLLIAIIGEPLFPDERAIFEALTGRDSEPLAPIEEFWGSSVGAAARRAPWPSWGPIWRHASTIATLWRRASAA